MWLVEIGFQVVFCYKFWRLVKLYCGFIKVFDCIFFCCLSFVYVYVSMLLVFDFKVGFIDYDKERREFYIDVFEFFNFVNVLDEWV